MFLVLFRGSTEILVYFGISNRHRLWYKLLCKTCVNDPFGHFNIVMVQGAASLKTLQRTPARSLLSFRTGWNTRRLWMRDLLLISGARDDLADIRSKRWSLCKWNDENIREATSTTVCTNAAAWRITEVVKIDLPSEIQSEQTQAPEPGAAESSNIYHIFMISEGESMKTTWTSGVRPGAQRRCILKYAAHVLLKGRQPTCDSGSSWASNMPFVLIHISLLMLCSGSGQVPFEG